MGKEGGVVRGAEGGVPLLRCGWFRAWFDSASAVAGPSWTTSLGRLACGDRRWAMLSL